VSKNLHLVIFGDGEQTRDFVHVHDVVEANILALRTKRIAGETFNVGTGIAATINQLADMLLEVTNKTCLKVKHSKPTKGDIKHSVADISKAKMKLHYYPKVSLKEGLKNLTKSFSIQK
jgi:UDP-glucose 4-epimerase